VRLEVVRSSLNDYHSFFLDNPDLIKEKLASYMPSYDFVLNPHKDRQHGIESISFFKSEQDNTPYKISRGEERIFIWCFFLALFEVEEFSQKQNRHILIDDPVSSLDESNVLLTAQWIFDLITSEFRKKRFIISTHHIGLFSILGTWLGRMDEKNALHDLYILKSDKDNLTLRNTNQEVFLYHLHLLQTLQNARNGTLYKYHIVLLRQVLENVNSFLGSRKIGRLLSHIGVEDPDNKSDTINAYSHKQAFQLQASEMSEHEETVFEEVFDKLMAQYRFKLP
jgi:wobble nucleotide-excising tRNase